MTTPICANLDQHQGGELSVATGANSVDCRKCEHGYNFETGLGYRCAQAEVEFPWDAVASDPCSEFRPKPAPPPPPVEGPGLAEAARKAEQWLRELSRKLSAGGPRPHPSWAENEADALEYALATEEERAKLRREVAALFARDDVPGNLLTYRSDDGVARTHLEIADDTAAAIRALFAAELGSTP